MKVVSADFDPMDDIAKLWHRVANEIHHSPLSLAVKIGVLESIKHDLLADMRDAREGA